METLTINGKTYKRKSEKTNKPISKVSITKLLLTTFAMGVKDRFDIERREKEIDSIELIQEYQLIQQKKSHLTASKRRKVVYIFNKYFEKV